MSLQLRVIRVAAMLFMLAAAFPAPMAASEQPAPPKPLDRRPVGAVALGEWYYLDGGRLVCETPGTNCLIITLGPVRLFVPVASPSGRP